MNDQAKKITKNRQKKEVIVTQLSEKASRAKAMVFTNYQGMTHIQLEHLKRALKNTQAELVVAKNTLLSLSLKIPNTKYQIPNLEGPTGTIFAYEDIVAPLKELAKTIRLLKLPTIKFGIVEGKLLAEAEIMRLSTLPSREALISQLIGGLKSPIYGLHRALSWNIQKLVMTLSAIQQKRV